MMWRRFAGSNGSYRGCRSTAETRFGRGGLLAVVLLATCGAQAGQYDGYGGVTVQEGVLIGDDEHGGERSVIVSDGADDSSAPYGAGEAVTMPTIGAGDWTRYGFSPAIINRCLGPACPRWVGQADVLMLWQGNVPATPLLALDVPPNTVTLAGNQLANGMATGPRTAILLNIDRCDAIEANYFNAGNFSGTRNFMASIDGQLAWDALGNYNVGNIDSGDFATSGYIQSLELNWRRYNGRSLTFLAGFRWIEWNESLALTDAYDDGVDPPGIDTLDAVARNDLYGGQIGLDAVLLTLFNVVRFNGVAKAGVYANPNATATTTVGGDRIPPETYTATGKSTGFFGEVGVNGTVRLTEHFFWRAGYNFFWISGVATSLNQLQTVDMTAPDGPINLDGSVFLHGVNTGIEAIW